MKAIGPVESATLLSQSVIALAARGEGLFGYLFQCRSEHDGESQKYGSFEHETSYGHDAHRLCHDDDSHDRYRVRCAYACRGDVTIAEKDNIRTFYQRRIDDRPPFRLYKTSKKCQISYSTWKKSQVLE